jgi:ribosome-associated protein
MLRQVYNENLRPQAIQGLEPTREQFFVRVTFIKEWTIDTTTKPVKVRPARAKPGTELDALTLARLAVAAAADKKGENMVLLDLRKLSSVTDYFVICTGAVDRQLEAIADNITNVIKSKHQIGARHVEGSGETGWVLIDYVDVVIHVFTPSLRSYYSLESLWANAPVLLRMQ